METFRIDICIQSIYGKIRTRKNRETDTFHAVSIAIQTFFICNIKLISAMVVTSVFVEFRELTNDVQNLESLPYNETQHSLQLRDALKSGHL